MYAVIDGYAIIAFDAVLLHWKDDDVFEEALFDWQTGWARNVTNIEYVA